MEFDDRAVLQHHVVREVVERVVGDASPGHEHFDRLRDRSSVTPDTSDLGPAVRFVELQRKLSEFDSIDDGDRPTFGGLRGRETRLVDGRDVRGESVNRVRHVRVSIDPNAVQTRPVVAVATAEVLRNNGPAVEQAVESPTADDPPIATPVGQRDELPRDAGTTGHLPDRPAHAGGARVRRRDEAAVGQIDLDTTREP